MLYDKINIRVKACILAYSSEYSSLMEKSRQQELEAAAHMMVKNGERISAGTTMLSFLSQFFCSVSLA